MDHQMIMKVERKSDENDFQIDDIKETFLLKSGFPIDGYYFGDLLKKATFLSIDGQVIINKVQIDEVK